MCKRDNNAAKEQKKAEDQQTVFDIDVARKIRTGGLLYLSLAPVQKCVLFQ